MANVQFKGMIMKDIQKKEEKEVEPNIKRELEFTPFYRWHHWIRVFSIIALTITGFYIATPFITPAVSVEPTNFLYAEFRGIHEIFGFILVSLFVAKVYYFFFAERNKREIQSFKDLFSIQNWKKQLGYYLFMTKHPEQSGAYNVVQLVAYLVFYIVTAGLVLTGLILYVHNYHDGLGGLLYAPMRYFEVMLGGIAFVRELHHVLIWGVIIFVVAHLYMVVFNAIHSKEGTADSIFGGYKFKRKD